jgi:hypothetical protein
MVEKPSQGSRDGAPAARSRPQHRQQAESPAEGSSGKFNQYVRRGGFADVRRCCCHQGWLWLRRQREASLLWLWSWACALALRSFRRGPAQHPSSGFVSTCRGCPWAEGGRLVLETAARRAVEIGRQGTSHEEIGTGAAKIQGQTGSSPDVPSQEPKPPPLGRALHSRPVWPVIHGPAYTERRRTDRERS